MELLKISNGSLQFPDLHSPHPVIQLDVKLCMSLLVSKERD
jgi:hypothetical protein